MLPKPPKHAKLATLGSTAHGATDHRVLVGQILSLDDPLDDINMSFACCAREGLLGDDTLAKP
jgi:hypothetical protein